VQSAFRDIGATVRRDTDMQRDSIGHLAAAAREIAALRRNDLIYLPGHVLIYAGGGEVIHADGGSMMVRRDDLAAWLKARNLALESLTIRRC
jgi:cell wall-associated NlpC family hydrolase